MDTSEKMEEYINAPFVAFSNDELKDLPNLGVRDKIVCPRCSKKHKLEPSVNLTTGEIGGLLFYRCGDSSWLAGVDGKNVMGTFPR